jgi:hypothetical protein
MLVKTIHPRGSRVIRGPRVEPAQVTECRRAVMSAHSQAPRVQCGPAAKLARLKSGRLKSELLKSELLKSELLKSDRLNSERWKSELLWCLMPAFEAPASAPSGADPRSAVAPLRLPVPPSRSVVQGRMLRRNR